MTYRVDRNYILHTGDLSLQMVWIYFDYEQYIT